MSDTVDGFKMEMDGPQVKRISIAGKEIPLVTLAEVNIRFAPFELPQVVLTYDTPAIDIKNAQ